MVLKNKSKNYKRTLGIIFLLPSVFFIAFSNVIPFIWNTIMSFQEWDGFGAPIFVGLDNFARAFKDPIFKDSVLNSIYLGIGSTIISVVLGVLLAFAIFRLGRKEGAIYRLILFMPTMLPMSVVGLMFIFILNYDYGILNELLRLVGLGAFAKPWLSDPDTVMPVLVIVRGWKCLGIPMLLCVAAMQGIPKSLFESAYLDGASTLKTYKSIVMPLILPIIQLSFVITLMTSFKVYDIVKILTNGGPGRSSYVVPMYMMDQAFKFDRFGYAAAMGTIFTVIIIVVIVLSQKLMKGEQYEL